MTSTMTAKKLFLAGAFVVAATSAALAQEYQRHYFGYRPGAGYANGYYGYSPGYWGGYYDYDQGARYHRRGGPGRRVGNGAGMGAGPAR